MDEAGRGPLAGPVVAAAVVLGEAVPSGLADSKTLSAKRRAVLDEAIRASCGWAVAVVEPEEIDRLNIFQATMEAMTRCVRDLAAQLPGPPEVVLIDGETGRLIEDPNDLAGFGAALCEILDDDELRRRLGDGGRARVLVTHLGDTHLERWLGVVKAMLDGE